MHGDEAQLRRRMAAQPRLIAMRVITTAAAQPCWSWCPVSHRCWHTAAFTRCQISSHYTRQVDSQPASQPSATALRLCTMTHMLYGISDICQQQAGWPTCHSLQAVSRAPVCTNQFQLKDYLLQPAFPDVFTSHSPFHTRISTIQSVVSKEQQSK